MQKRNPKKTVMPPPAKTVPAKEPKHVPKTKIEGPKAKPEPPAPMPGKPTTPPWRREKK